MLRNPILRFFGVAIIVVALAVIAVGAAFIYVAGERLEEVVQIVAVPTAPPLSTPPPVPTAFPTPRPPLPEDRPSESSSVIGQTTMQQSGSLAVQGMGQQTSGTFGTADNVLPGDPTNIYGQKVYADLDTLVEGSDMIVFVRIDGDAIRPNSRLTLMHDQVFGQTREWEQLHGRSMTPVEMLKMFAIDGSLSSEYIEADFTRWSGLWTAPSMTWLHHGPFFEANPAAHKGMFSEGFNRHDINLPTHGAYPLGGNNYTNRDHSNLIYIRNPRKIIDAGLVHAYKGRLIDRIPPVHAVLFLNREGPLDNDLDRTLWHEFFKLRERTDTDAPWQLYREAGDPSVAIIQDDGQLRFIPTVDDDWTSREPLFRTSITDLANRLASENIAYDDLVRQQFDVSPIGLIDGYAEFLQTEWGRIVMEETRPAFLPFEVARRGKDQWREQWTGSYTQLEYSKQSIADRLETLSDIGVSIRPSTDFSYHPDRIFMGYIDRHIQDWHIRYGFPVDGARTLYTFVWNIPPLISEHHRWGEMVEVSSGPVAGGDVTFIQVDAQEILGTIHALPDNVSLPIVDSIMLDYAQRLPLHDRATLEFVPIFDAFYPINPDSGVERELRYSSAVGEQSYSARLVSRHTGGLVVMDTLVFRRNNVVVSLQVKHATDLDLEVDPPVDLTTTARELDDRIIEFVDRFEEGF